ncbi:hypothetical protein F1880_007987 [Penicillium rolfsii]|nr:hypothetical protein F1880_007987 [Penicillium rolfsii]
MFIAYDPSSNKTKTKPRQTINAFVAATASVKRRGLKNKKYPTEVAVNLEWLHERPIIMHSGENEAEQETFKSLPPVSDGGTGNTSGAEVKVKSMAHAYGRSKTGRRSSIKRVISEGHIPGHKAIERPFHYIFSFPVPKKEYYSALLVQRQKDFLAVADQYRDTFAYSIHNDWTQTMLSDPCLFHATIFATSCLGDMLRQTLNNPVTIRHKFETLKLLQKAIDSRYSRGLSDIALIATLYLLFFAKVNGNLAEGKMHDAGIDLMIKLRQNKEFPIDSYAHYLVKMRHVWTCIVDRAETVFTSPRAGPRLLIGRYTSLLSMALQKQLERAPRFTLPFSILQFMKRFDDHVANAYDSIDSLLPQSPPTSLGSPTDSNDDNTQSVIVHALHCCKLATGIYWRVIVSQQHRSPCPDPHLDADVQDLKSAVLLSDTLFWLQYGPEIIRWILLVGAMAAPRLTDQNWFITRCTMLTSFIRPQDLEAFILGVDHMLGLFNQQREAHYLPIV